MKKSPLLYVALAWAIVSLIGCTSSNIVADRPSADYSYEEFNKKMADEECTLIFTNDEKRSVRDASITGDSLSWTELPKKRIVFPKTEVDKILIDKGNVIDEIVVLLKSGQRFTPKDINLTKDSVSWSWEVTTIKTVVPLAQVKKLVIVSHPAGVLEGLGLGFLAGGAGGTLVAAILVSGDKSSSLAYPILFLEGGAGGLVLGAVIGGTIGHKDEYTIEPKKKE